MEERDERSAQAWSNRPDEAGTRGEEAGCPAGAVGGASKPVSPNPRGSQPPVVRNEPEDPFCRAENEDDDGYDPYSDRPEAEEPLFERNPWA